MFASKLLGLVFFFISINSFSQQLLINEISQGTGAKEYVEFVVAGNPNCDINVPCLDLRGVVIDDNNGYFAAGSGTGIATGAVRFADITFWSCIPQGTLILVYNNTDVNTAIPADDLTMADGNCSLIIPINSTLFEGQSTSPSSSVNTYPQTASWIAGNGTWSQIAMSNSNDSFQIRNTITSATPNHSVSWGNNNTNTQITFASASGSVFSMMNSIDDNSFSQANWTSGNVPNDETPGTYNNTLNGNWISAMNPQCGISNPLYIAISSTPTGCTATCTGTATIIISGGTGPYQTLWSTSETTTTINNLCAATYTVEVTDDAGCTITEQVTVSNSGSTLQLTLTPTNESCDGLCDGEITSVPSGGSSPYSYLWSNAEVTPDIANLCPGNYSLTITDNSGCTISVSETINAGAVTGDATITTSGPFTTTDAAIQFIGAQAGGVWTADCGSCISQSGMFDPQIAGVGTFEICYSVGSGVCADQDCVEIIVNDGCTPQTTSENHITCPNGSISISGQVYTAPGTYSDTYIDILGCDSTHTINYNWHQTNPIELMFSECQGDTVEFNGDYYFETTYYEEQVTDANGCIVTNTFLFSFDDCYAPDYNVFIPNVFTPNNDFVNDLFEISITGGYLESGFIINRWGEQVHEFHENLLTWDGRTRKGMNATDGVYTYVVKVRETGGVVEVYHGFVTLLR